MINIAGVAIGVDAAEDSEPARQNPVEIPAVVGVKIAVIDGYTGGNGIYCAASGYPVKNRIQNRGVRAVYRRYTSGAAAGVAVVKGAVADSGVGAIGADGAALTDCSAESEDTVVDDRTRIC